MTIAWSSLLTKPKTVHWGTPVAVYRALDSEFHFTMDACPLGESGGLFSPEDGLLKSWGGHRVYCNPPYGPGIGEWLRRGQEADLAVYLLPARTDTLWWMTYSPRAVDVRFIRGRIKFCKNGETGPNSAPFPSVVLIFRG